MPPFKRVLIVGPDMPAAHIAEIEERYKAYGEPYCIIGDGTKYINDEDLATLQGKIGPGTQIHINGHGLVSEGTHYISLLDAGFPATPTAYVLEKIQVYAGERAPLHIELWSCYGGAAAKESHTLSPASTLTTHGTAENSTMMAMSTEGIKQPASSSPFITFAHHLIASPETLTISQGSFKYAARPPKQPLHSLSEIAAYLDFSLGNYQEALAEHGLPSQTEEIGSLRSALKEPLSEEMTARLTRYRNEAYFLFLARVSPEDTQLLEFLKTNQIDPNTIALSDGYTALRNAISSNHPHQLSAFLEAGADVNEKDENGDTALHLAALKGFSAVAEILLQHGAKLDVKDKNGFTPISNAISMGHAKTAEVFLRYGADANEKDKDGWSLLHWASIRSHADIAQVLLTAKADVNEPDQYSDTALHHAASKGDVKMATLLLNAGADANARNILHQTPYDIAQKEGHSEAIETLLAWERENARSAEVQAPPAFTFSTACKATLKKYVWAGNELQIKFTSRQARDDFTRVNAQIFPKCGITVTTHGGFVQKGWSTVLSWKTHTAPAELGDICEKMDKWLTKRSHGNAKPSRTYDK